MTLNPRQFDQLRQWRNRPEPDLTLANLMGGIAADLKRRERSMGDVAGAFTRLAPAPLRAGATLATLSRGTLLIRQPNAALRFQLDRWLRDGGELALVKACPTRLTRVKLQA